MERKFKQAVWMKCEKDEQRQSLAYLLKSIGYKMDSGAGKFDTYPIVCTRFSDQNDLFAFTAGDWRAFPESYFKIDHYNPDLFLAIAAQSEGEEFWPGEWVALKNGGYLYESIGNKGDLVFLKSYANGGLPHPFEKSCFRKATLEELVAHFTKDRPSELEPGHFTNKTMQEVADSSPLYKAILEPYLKAEQPWQPKNGEMIEVSDDGREWYYREFIGMHGLFYVCFKENDVDGYITWSHAREFRKKDDLVLSQQEVMQLWRWAEGTDIYGIKETPKQQKLIDKINSYLK